MAGVRGALAELPESAALEEAWERARFVATIRAREADDAGEGRWVHRDAAQMYMPGWPWEQIARSPEIAAVYRRFVRPSMWGRATGRLPMLWTRLVRDVMVDDAV